MRSIRLSVCTAVAIIGIIAAPALAQSPVPAPTATPIPTPTPTGAPPITLGGDFLISSFHTSGVNAVGALDTSTGIDKPDRTDFSDLLVNLAGSWSRFKATASIGEYAFPTVGFAINHATQAGANTELYGALPVVSVQYALTDRWSIAAGKFASLLGQESPMTYQNVDVQRGLAWSMEPTISRGAHVSYAQGVWSGTLEYNDAYYSGNNRAFEWIIGYAPSANTNVQFAAIVPNPNAAPNPTVSVGNKAEYDLMYTRQIGKVQLLPYVLWVSSPSSGSLGYPRAESAFAAVFMGTYAFNQYFLVAARVEDASNGSSAGDTSPNADLVGYGPGSGATSLTVTPTYHRGWTFVRAEYSRVAARNAAPGLAFGPTGTQNSQDRIGVEFGVMH